MLKQRLLMASAGIPPVSIKNLFTWGDNTGGSTAQNTSTGFTNFPTAAVDSHTTWQQISAGSNTGGTGSSVTGLLSDGTLWSWGYNGSAGYIGQGTSTTQLLVPTQIGSVNTWAYVSQGEVGGMAIRSDGTLWSWGTDTYGQLGQGGGSVVKGTPTQVGSATNWAKCYCGLQISFMIKTDGTLWTLGRNSFYGTGLNTSSGNTTTPTQIGSSTLWVSIANNGTFDAIGIRSDGTAWAWGSDQNGELGQGSAGVVLKVPTQIGTATNWAEAAMSGSQSTPFTLLRKTTNTLWACGSNSSYQTGLNTSSGNTLTITQVGSASNWTQIAALDKFVGLGLDSSGKIWSWGDNSNYATGQNTSSGFTQVPTQIGSISTWKYITGNGAVGIGLK